MAAILHVLYLEGSLLLAHNERVLVASVGVCAFLPCWAPPGTQNFLSPPSLAY